MQAVVLPRTLEQETLYRALDGAIVPERPVEARSLLAFADVAVGGGGTMNRESALLGTPTYTVFQGQLAAVDAALIEAGFLRDLRTEGTLALVKRSNPVAAISPDRREAILDLIVSELTEIARPGAEPRPAGRESYSSPPQ